MGVGFIQPYTSIILNLKSFHWLLGGSVQNHAQSTVVPTTLVLGLLSLLGVANQALLQIQTRFYESLQNGPQRLT